MIKKILLLIVANAVVLYITQQVLGGQFTVTGGIEGFVIAGILIGVLNGIAKPILKILALPFVLLTGGLFILVINTFLVWFTQYALTVLKFDGVAIQIQGGIVTYFLAGLILAIANLLFYIQFSVQDILFKRVNLEI